MRKMSGRWVPPSYGSFSITTSPGSKVPPNLAITACIASGIEPSCIGRVKPWASSSPSSEQYALDRSLDDLRLDEYAVRIIVSAISSTTDSTAFLTSSRVTGSVAISGAPILGRARFIAPLHRHGLYGCDSSRPCPGLVLAGWCRGCPGLHRQARVGGPLGQRAIVDGHVLGPQQREHERAAARRDAGPAVGDDL